MAADAYENMSREELLQEVRLMSLRRQVTPHFLFNSISVAMSLVMQTPHTAVTFLRLLARMYRYLLIYGNEYHVPIEQELQMMRQYYDLMCLRHVGSILLTIDDDVMKLKKHPLPPLALQGLLENAIKHNSHMAEHPLEIRLSLRRDEGLWLSISNNIVPLVSKVKSTKMGLAYINETFRLLYNKEMRILRDEKTYTVLLPLI